MIVKHILAQLKHGPALPAGSAHLLWHIFKAILMLLFLYLQSIKMIETVYYSTQLFSWYDEFVFFSVFTS